MSTGSDEKHERRRRLVARLTAEQLRTIGTLDMYGNRYQAVDTTGMMSPVECRHCRVVYDLTAVETTARYSDCTVFVTPCCGRSADDREWKSVPDFRRLR